MINCITGPMNSGKTTRLKEAVIRDLGSQTVDGFYTEKVFEGDLIIGFDLVHIKDEERKVLARKEIDFLGGNYSELGHYKFLDETFEWANGLLEKMTTDLIVIDEIGKLELTGGGFAPAIEALCKKKKTLYVTVRDSFFEEIAIHFNLEGYYKLI